MKLVFLRRTEEGFHEHFDYENLYAKIMELSMWFAEIHTNVRSA